jgi:hypothetical protein
MFIVAEVALEWRAGGVVVTQQALSPKIGGGWHTLFWNGARTWTTFVDDAALFPTVEAALDALRRSQIEYRIEPMQGALFGPEEQDTWRDFQD